MPTTLSDEGRLGKHGQIPFYYAFPFRFYFAESQIAPDDVLSWCQEHCNGYYKVASYTHRSSVRSAANPSQYDNKVVYIDRIFLSSENDAIRIKLTFNVKTVKVMRPKIEPLKRNRRS
jgi:hypothetical protein